MTTTYTAFTNAVAGIVIPSVSAEGRLAHPPLSVNTADLPCSFPMLPTGINDALIFCGNNGWPTFTVDWIVIIEAVGQSRIDENFFDTIAIMDEIQTALCDLDFRPAKGKLEWTITTRITPIGDVNYWSVVTSITGYG